MPILHAQINANGTDGSGNLVVIPPREALRLAGPRIQVLLSVSDSVGSALLQKGEPVPEPIAGMALFDSGAQCTCVDDDIAEQLKLPIIDQTKMISASHTVDSNIYPLKLEVVGVQISINVERAMGATLRTQDIIALIGRDVLALGTLFYNGLTGEITFAL